MKKLILLCCLTGCSPYIEDWQMVSFTQKCENHGGISSINTTFGVFATCKDGLLVYPERPDK